MRIVKNWLDKDLAHRVRNYLLDQPYTYNSTSHFKNTGRSFLVSEFNLNTNKEIESLFPHLIKHFDHDIEIIRAYANLQFIKMDGDWHTDDGETTCLWMATQTLPQGSGPLQLKNKREDIKFDFNKLIMFDAKRPHRGLAPKEFNTPRITLAFKTRKNA